MVGTCVTVKIEQNNSCIFEKSTENAQGGNNLPNLVKNLKYIQQQVNDFLTTLVETDQNSKKGQTETTESEDDESDEEDQKDPKKLKLNAKMATTLSNQAQLRYIVEWFQEWSEMQRSDFLGVLIERCGPVELVNGLVTGIEGLGCKDEPARPPSLFQCRVKLFQEWSQNWSAQEKDNLLTSIKNIDSKFAEKYERRLATDNADGEDSS